MSAPTIPPFRVGDEETFAPGVIGFKYKYQGTTYYPIVTATNPGNGDVGRWLDSLDGRVGFVMVLSQKLAGMLERRGFTKVTEPVGIDGEFVVVHRRDGS